MESCQSVEASQEHSIAEFLRGALVELLKYLRADRQIAPNGRLLRRCEVCGFETTGMGIHSHRNKHCSEYGYLIDRENKIRREAFFALIAPYEHGIDKVVRATSDFTKIEMANYDQSERALTCCSARKCHLNSGRTSGSTFEPPFQTKRSPDFGRIFSNGCGASSHYKSRR